MSEQKEYIYCPFCARTLEFQTEESRVRKICHSCKWTHYPTPAVASAAIIVKLINNVPHILMVKRKREPFSGTWMFPAGFLEMGEHPGTDTLPREVREEVGLTVTDSRLIKIVKSADDPRSHDHLVLFYLVEAEGDIANNDENENSDIRWIAITNPVDIGFPHHKEIFNTIRENYLKPDVFI